MTTEWGERAANLYSRDYAQRYRAADDALQNSALVARFSQWLRTICESFGRDIRALDLGCGTGRYFRALRHVRELVAIDVSDAMLAEAQRPVDDGAVTVGRITTLHADFLNYDFTPGQFDLVYSIGVLAEHSPFDASVARRVFSWLARGGIFAFTAVHRESFSVPRTTKRTLAHWVLPFTTGGWRRALRDRLMAHGLYADEERLREVLEAAGFVVDSIDRYQSDVHLHCLTIARKPA